MIIMKEKMNLFKKWLGISAIEKRQAGMEEVINHLIVHLTEAREHIDKLSAMVLTYQSKTFLQTEIPVVETKSKPKPKKKKSNGK